jgi:hypothetical protein
LWESQRKTLRKCIFMKENSGKLSSSSERAQKENESRRLGLLFKRVKC